LLFGLPILAYLVMKFGAAGYFRAKQRQQENQRKKEHATSKEQ
jgi:hypothetical protein